MAKKNLRICICCGKEYEYCYHCGNRSAATLWKNNYCCESCRDVFNLITDYRAGEVTREAAKEMLKAIKMENRANYNYESIGKYVNELIGNPNAVTENKEQDGEKVHSLIKEERKDRFPKENKKYFSDK